MTNPQLSKDEPRKTLPKYTETRTLLKRLAGTGTKAATVH